MKSATTTDCKRVCSSKNNSIPDCLWQCSEALRIPQHFAEELYNRKVCHQDNGFLVRLHHLPLLGHRHHSIPTCLAHRIRTLDLGVVLSGQV